MKITRETLKRFLSPKDLVLFYRRWTEEEIDILEQNYGNLPVKQIAVILHRSSGDVRYMIRVLQLANIKPQWTEEEVVFLKEHKDWPRRKLAKYLGKTKKAVEMKLARL